MYLEFRGRGWTKEKQDKVRRIMKKLRSDPQCPVSWHYAEATPDCSCESCKWWREKLKGIKL